MKLVALGDKLSNARSLKRDYQMIGDKLMERFNMKDKRRRHGIIGDYVIR